MTLRTLLAAVAVTALLGGSAAAEDFTKIPAPAMDQPASGAATETLVLAGGCFWGVQGVFQHVKGVTNAVSGYTGGMAHTATYDQVSTGETGHAESVQITYDPKQITLGKLLQVFFSVVHDPTQLNRQGPDHGSQYRSAIFPSNDKQAEFAKTYIAQLNKARVFKSAIMTKIEMRRAFYPAESYHQDYLTAHPNQPYIVYNDIPKVAELAKMYPALYRADPVLVSAKDRRQSSASR
jgi:peptide-methionine (S)-S-oxide reductase